MEPIQMPTDQEMADFAIRKYALEIAHAGVAATAADPSEVIDNARDFYRYLTATDPVLDQSNEEQDSQMELPLNVVHLEDFK